MEDRTSEDDPDDDGLALETDADIDADEFVGWEAVLARPGASVRDQSPDLEEASQHQSHILAAAAATDADATHGGNAPPGNSAQAAGLPRAARMSAGEQVRTPCSAWCLHEWLCTSLIPVHCRKAYCRLVRAIPGHNSQKYPHLYLSLSGRHISPAAAA